ncbi:M35 family metallo-endopeptidase [Streptomyces sp. NPDC048845]|uniref:M35 family metallo-endopeptidase n=1 Tax=Streptomyces sp. NPDC048845 TaxID=3155390 RepID=UPI00341D60FB
MSDFWAPRATAPDGTPPHGKTVREWSHAKSPTEDYAYGQNACTSLAANDPRKAVFNADNHKYFVEFV